MVCNRCKMVVKTELETLGLNPIVVDLGEVEIKEDNINDIKERLLKRLENPEDNWKFSTGDLKERALWDDYMKYYEEAINKTSTDSAPWYIIPADDKGVARYIVAKIIWEEMEKLTDIAEPELDPKVKANIEEYRTQLKKM